MKYDTSIALQFMKLHEHISAMHYSFIGRWLLAGCAVIVNHVCKWHPFLHLFLVQRNTWIWNGMWEMQNIFRPFVNTMTHMTFIVTGKSYPLPHPLNQHKGTACGQRDLPCIHANTTIIHMMLYAVAWATVVAWATIFWVKTWYTVMPGYPVMARLSNDQLVINSGSRATKL